MRRLDHVLRPGRAPARGRHRQRHDDDVDPRVAGDRGEHLAERLVRKPGGDVERVGDGDIGREQRLHAPHRLPRQRREREAPRLERVREQHGDAARRRCHRHARPVESRRPREVRRRLDEMVELGHLEKARRPRPGPPWLAPAREGAGVRARGAGAGRGGSELQRDHRDAAGRGPLDGGRDAERLPHLLDQARDGAGPAVVDEPVEVVREGQVRLVARRDEQAHAEAPVGRAVEEAAAEPARLREHRHRTRQEGVELADRREGQRHSIPGVDEPHRVRTEESHARPPRALHQARLLHRPGCPRLGEAGAEDHREGNTGAAAREYCVGGLSGRQADPGDVRSLRQGVDARIRGKVPDHAMAGVHRIHAARIAVTPQEVERARARTREVAGHSDQRDRPRREQAPEVRRAPRHAGACLRHGAHLSPKPRPSQDPARRHGAPPASQALAHTAFCIARGAGPPHNASA